MPTSPVLFLENASLSKSLFESYISNCDYNDSFYKLSGVSYSFLYGDLPYEKYIFRLLNNYYRNDFFVRYSFFNSVLSKKQAVSFFELPLNDSRADVVSVNGKSTAFEIKTDYDSFDRLLKQITDYSSVFEYVHDCQCIVRLLGIWIFQL